MSDTLGQLEAALKSADTVRARIDALNDLAEHFRTISHQQTHQLAEEALALAQAEEYVKGIADSLNNLAWCDLVDGHPDTALERVLSVVDMVSGDDDLAGAHGKALSIRGLVHLQVGDLPLALEQMLSALSYARVSGDMGLVAGITNDIGIVYLETQDYPLALEQFNDSLRIVEESLPFPQGRAAPVNNLCCVCIEQGDYENAAIYGQRALEITRQIASLTGQAHALVNLGNIHHKQGQFDQARDMYLTALPLARDSKDGELVVETLKCLGELCLDQDDVDCALVHLEEAYSSATAMDATLQIAKLQELLSRAHEEAGDFEQALQIHKQFCETSRKIFSQSSGARLKTVQTLHEVEAAQREQEILRLRNTALEREIAERAQNETERLERERLQIQLESEHNLTVMKSRVMMRIAHEFRTPLSVILTTTQLLTRYFERISVEERTRYENVIKEEVQRLANMLDDITVVLRTTSDRPTAFQPLRLDLVRVCHDLVSEFEQGHPASPRIKTSIEAADRIGLVDMGLLRCIVNGLLENAYQFSRHKSPVEFHMSRDAHQMILTVSDHGIGIPPDEMESIFLPFHRGSNVGEIPGMGLGLSIVRDCVTRHNGSIEVTSHLGEGTTVLVHLDVSSLVSAQDPPAF